MKDIVKNIRLSRYITSGLEDVLPNLIQMIRKQKPEVTDEEAESTIRHLWNIIPQGNKNILAPWLIKIWLSNNGYIDEDRVISLINTIYKAKKMFPNDFPSTFNINDYRSLDELEDFLDPWIIKLSNLQQKHIDIEKSKELGQVVFQKGDYKILRIDDPKDIVKFQELNGLTCWCIKRLDEARNHGTTWFLYRRNDIIGAYDLRDKVLWDRNDDPMKNPEAVKIFIEFLRQEGKEDEMSKLIVNIPMTKEEIDKYLDREKNLKILYQRQHQRLTPEQIDKAIDIGKDLDWLYDHQTLTPENIDKAMEKEGDFNYLHWLYATQTLTPKQIDKVIDKGEYLNYLRKYQKLSPEQKKRIEKKLGLRKSIKLL